MNFVPLRQGKEEEKKRANHETTNIVIFEKNVNHLCREIPVKFPRANRLKQPTGN